MPQKKGIGALGLFFLDLFFLFGGREGEADARFAFDQGLDEVVVVAFLDDDDEIFGLEVVEIDGEFAEPFEEVDGVDGLDREFLADEAELQDEMRARDDVLRADEHADDHRRQKDADEEQDDVLHPAVDRGLIVFEEMQKPPKGEGKARKGQDEPDDEHGDHERGKFEGIAFDGDVALIDCFFHTQQYKSFARKNQILFFSFCAGREKSFPEISVSLTHSLETNAVFCYNKTAPRKKNLLRGI